MRRSLRNHRGAVVAVGSALAVGLGVAGITAGWQRVEHVLGAIMAVLTVLLLLKAAVVFVSIGLRLLLSLTE